jgi:hypothetical protein
MAAAPTTPNLDQGPPLPPNLQPQAQPNVQQMAGQPSGDTSGNADLMKTVAERLMFAEQAMMQAGAMLPALAPVMKSVIADMQRKAGAVLAQGATPAPPQPPLMAGLVGGPAAGPSGGAGQ